MTYHLGGWAAPWGIEYRIDTLSVYMLLIVSGIGAAVITYSPLSISREIEREQHHLFYSAYLLCLTGLLGITVTGDLFNLFVFLEISSLSSYALISLGAKQSRKALTAAFQYLVMGTIGATFILIGIGLMYQMTGTLNMTDIALRLTAFSGTRTVLVAFAFLTVGISLKMALFPLHAWLPGAYTFAPSVVTAFLAATATKVSVYILLRLVFTIFKPGFAFEFLRFDNGLMVLSLIGIFVASTVAIFQTNVKRMLAYSSVAQVGYMALGISFAVGDRVDGWNRSSVEPCVNQRRPVSGGRLYCVSSWIGTPRRPARPGASDAGDHVRLGTRRPWLGGSAHHGGICEQVVFT